MEKYGQLFSSLSRFFSFWQLVTFPACYGDNAHHMLWERQTALLSVVAGPFLRKNMGNSSR
jgi:hypothetical protein